MIVETENVVLAISGDVELTARGGLRRRRNLPPRKGSRTRLPRGSSLLLLDGAYSSMRLRVARHRLAPPVTRPTRGWSRLAGPVPGAAICEACIAVDAVYTHPSDEEMAATLRRLTC